MLMRDRNKAIYAAASAVLYSGQKSLGNRTIGSLSGHRYVSVSERNLTQRINANYRMDDFRKVMKGRINVMLSQARKTPY